MKFPKIGHVIIIVWKDACTLYQITAEKFMSEGLAINHTVGWLRGLNKTQIVVSHETTTMNEREDLTMIPTNSIIKVYDLGNYSSKKT